MRCAPARDIFSRHIARRSVSLIWMPMFGAVFWLALDRIDPLLMAPAAGLAVVGWVRSFDSPRRLVRHAVIACGFVVLISAALTVTFATALPVVQLALLAVAVLLAAAGQGALSRIGPRWPRYAARLLGALAWLAVVSRLVPLAYQVPVVTDQPRAVMLTSLPLVWGAAAGDVDAVLAGAAEPSPILTFLQRHIRLTLADTVDAAQLRANDVLILAQPRALAPAAMVEIDTWVRRGGRALVFADPQLRWPPPFALGDPRNPITTSALDPLLRRWGAVLDPPASGPGAAAAGWRDGEQRIATAGGGRFRRVGANCQVRASGVTARCSVGEGVVVLIADADLFYEDHWIGAGAADDPSTWAADNPAWVVDRIRRLSGRQPLMPRVRPVWRRESPAR